MARLIIFVLNLERRRDRRAWMEKTLVTCAGDEVIYVCAADGKDISDDGRLEHHGFSFTPASQWKLSADEIERLERHWSDLGYTPPDTDDLCEFYGRPINSGELACFASHHAAWVMAAGRLGVETEEGKEKKARGQGLCEHADMERSIAVVLEDDVTVLPCYDDRAHVHRSRWEHVWSSLRVQVEALMARGVHWDLLYLGRNRHGHDEPLGIPFPTTDEYQYGHVCRAGFSTCAHAYVLSTSGIEKLLSLSLHRQVMPVDDILPGLYAEHPRQDMKNRLLCDGGIRPLFQALSFREDLVWQLASITDGKEGMARASREGVQELLRSDITGSGPCNGGREMGVASGSRADSVRLTHATALGPPELVHIVAWTAVESCNGCADRRSHVNRRALRHWSCSLSCVCREWSKIIGSRGVWRAAVLRAVAFQSAESPSPPYHGADRSTAAASEPRVVFVESWRVTLATMHAGRVEAEAAQAAAEAENGLKGSMDHDIAAVGVGLESVCRSLLENREGDAGLVASYNDDSSQWEGTPLLQRVQEVDAGDEDEEGDDGCDFRRRFQRQRRPCLLKNGFDLAQTPAPVFTNFKDLVSALGHEWLSVLVPGARNPPYLIKMQLGNYVRDYLPYARACDLVRSCARDDEGRGETCPKACAKPLPPHAGVQVREVERRVDTTYDPLYLFDKDLPRSLSRPFAPPRQLQDDLLQDMASDAAGTSKLGQREDGHGEGARLDAPELLTEREWLVIGPAGSGSRWHIDPFGTSAWNLLLSGCKLWCICPAQVEAVTAPLLIRGEPLCALDWFSLLLLHPSSTALGKKRKAADMCGPGAARARFASLDGDFEGSPLVPHAPWLYAIQQPGDVIFVPHGTWHCVLNLQDSVAYTRNIVNAVNLRAALAELQGHDPHMYHDLAAWANKMRFS